jgi:hypothetical protein
MNLLGIGLIGDCANRMGVVNVIVIVESVQSLATTKSNTLKEFHIPSLVAVSAALGRQLSWLGCYS